MLIRRPGYTGPLCPHGGEFRVTLVKNRTLRVWCTCLAQYPSGSYVPEKVFVFDWIDEIDLNDDPRHIWEKHCEKVRGTEYVGHELRWSARRRRKSQTVSREPQVETSSNVNEYLK